jgi:hypothetical protein
MSAEGHVVVADATSSKTSPYTLHNETFVGGMGDVEKHIAMVYESCAQSFMLAVSTPDRRLKLGMHRMASDSIWAHVDVQSGSEQEKAVRSFFAQRGLEVPKDTGMPSQFLPDLPWEYSFNITPLPPDPAQLAILVCDLFRDVFGLGDESKLTFVCIESGEAV